MHVAGNIISLVSKRYRNTKKGLDLGLEVFPGDVDIGERQVVPSRRAEGQARDERPVATR